MTLDYTPPPHYTIQRAQMEWSVYGVVSVPDGDTRCVSVYDDEDDLYTNREQTFIPIETFYNDGRTYWSDRNRSF